MNQSHILLVDNDINFRASMQFELEYLGHRVETANDALSGINLFAVVWMRTSHLTWY